MAVFENKYFLPYLFIMNINYILYNKIFFNIESKKILPNEKFGNRNSLINLIEILHLIRNSFLIYLRRIFYSSNLLKFIKTIIYHCKWNKKCVFPDLFH